MGGQELDWRNISGMIAGSLCCTGSGLPVAAAQFIRAYEGKSLRKTAAGVGEPCYYIVRAESVGG